MGYNRRMSAEKNTKPVNDAVIVHSYPKLLFIWPIIAMGYVFWPIAALVSGSGDAAPVYSSTLEFFAWTYVFTLTLVILTIGIDIERNYAIFWAVALVACFFIGMYLKDVAGFTLFGNIYRHAADLDLRYPYEMMLILSILLSPPYFVMLLWARLQHKWRITHNEFEHYSWGRADDSLARGAKRVRSTYPDVLELLIAGAGTLIVYSATGRTELRRIRNVPLIFFARRRINQLLEQTEVTMHSDRAAAIQAEEIESESSEEDHGGPDEYDASQDNDDQSIPLAGDDDDGNNEHDGSKDPL